MDTKLPEAGRVTVVCAHPDDESFGLGAIIAAYTAAGTRVGVVCYTHGEASTLGSGDLAEVRARELRCAADVLGVAHTGLFDHPDGRLADIPLDRLTAHLDDLRPPPELLLVFDDTGITGHPDHRQATRAAVVWGSDHRVPVLAWTLAHSVAEALNTEFGTGFRGRTPEEVDIVLAVDRNRQLEAIRCHQSQATDNPVLWRRLELQADREHLRWLRRP